MNTSPMLNSDSTIALDQRSKALRRAIVMVLKSSQRGHLASALSLVEILRVLYDDILNYNFSDPLWSRRDRLILSKGHGCLALYVILAEKGFIHQKELSCFCRSDGLLGGHPERKVPGVEASTGSLGHGLSIGIGFALNEKYEKAGYRTFVVLGDGECNEGSIWEAAMCAGKYNLDRLTVVIDNNHLQSYGPTRIVQPLLSLSDKWRSFGFSVKEVDGHDISALRDCFNALPLAEGKPTAVICHTVKGKGISFVENNLDWHHKSNISSEQIENLITGLEAY